MNKTYKLLDLTEKEVEELRSCKDIKFVLSEHHPIHNSHITDDYGNEIKPRKGRWIKLSKRDIDKDLFKKEDVD